ncbi:uncharacterized protein EI90DRAFT_3036735 [Cantharellus anzutake]|uniref:uncharacterized protein n=1 Tax=Cantharellus anzutake TaxID=1750568 RepID=UPI001903D6E2|nr:uncharacterized protein EI90DRAFT_3036735 [Cantharellus anzutake]KAF8340751.1 hypothetical protein EI90DRAFT_3036735 [Cantharellus anzutake]
MLAMLPIELLYEIHLFALNAQLPLVSKSMHHTLRSAPESLRARWLMMLHPLTNEGGQPNVQLAHIVEASLLHPVCTPGVLRAIHRIHGLVPFSKKLPVIWIKLPRRLFRYRPNASPSTSIHNNNEDAITNVLDELARHHNIYKPNINSHKGYPLIMACHRRSIPLVTLLLSYGADPGSQGSLAVKIAIRQRNLELVKLLVERRAPSVIEARESQPCCTRTEKPRLQDRVRITPELVTEAIRACATDIAEYFAMKGTAPSFNALEYLL